MNKREKEKEHRYWKNVREYERKQRLETLKSVYCTSFCNHGHRLLDGKPVGHECYVLNPKVLRTEAFEGPREALDLGLPIHSGVVHRGLREGR